MVRKSDTQKVLSFSWPQSIKRMLRCLLSQIVHPRISLYSFTPLQPHIVSVKVQNLFS